MRDVYHVLSSVYGIPTPIEQVAVLPSWKCVRRFTVFYRCIYLFVLSVDVTRPTMMIYNTIYFRSSFLFSSLFLLELRLVWGGELNPKEWDVLRFGIRLVEDSIYGKNNITLEVF